VKKQFILLVVIVLSALFEFACFGSVTGPDGPEKKYKDYDLKITYKRTVINAGGDEAYVNLCCATPYGDGRRLLFSINDGTLTKVDGATFTALVQGVSSNDYSGAKKHYIWCVDAERYNASDKSLMVVGTDFYIEGPQNTIKLTHIVANTYSSYGGQMAQFTLTIDGLLIDG